MAAALRTFIGVSVSETNPENRIEPPSVPRTLERGADDVAHEEKKLRPHERHRQRDIVNPIDRPSTPTRRRMPPDVSA